MDKSTVLDTCVLSCGRLWHEELVGCTCTFHMVGCPRVVGTVHVQFARLYCYFVCAVVHDLCVGGCSKCVMQAMELCCVCVCVLMSMRIIVPRVISLVTCWYSVNKSVLSSTSWGDGSSRVLLLCLTICSVTATGYLNVGLLIRS